MAAILIPTNVLVYAHDRGEKEIKTTLAEWPTYGYRRITEQLRRGKWQVNHKRVQRLMRLMDIRTGKLVIVTVYAV